MMATTPTPAVTPAPPPPSAMMPPLPSTPTTPTTAAASAEPSSPSPKSKKGTTKNKSNRVSTIDHLLRNPPPELAAAPESFLDRFPSLAKSSPSLVQLLRTTAPSAAKRQSVMNLPANLVSERQAFFEGEIQLELEKLESSKEWFDIQKYVESYFGITLVVSTPPPALPALPPVPGGASRPRSPSVPSVTIPPVRSSPPKSAPPRTPTPTSAGIGRPTTPTGRPTTPTLRPSTPTPGQPKFGVHPSLARCLALLNDIASTWSHTAGKEYLTLAAPISEFMFHYKSAGCSPGLVDLSLVSAILAEMEAVDAATNGDLADEDVAAWKAQITHLLLTDRIRSELQRVERDQKREWAQAQVAKVRKEVFAATIKQLTSTGALKKRTDDDYIKALKSGAVLVKFIKTMVELVNLRARDEFSVPAPFDSAQVSKVLTAHDSGAGLVDATRNWMAVARGALKYLNLDLAGAWHVKVLTLGTPKPGADEGIELVTALLGARFAQVSGTPVVDLDAIDMLREYMAMVHPDQSWASLSPLFPSPELVAVTPTVSVIASTDEQGTWVQTCALAKQTVATARMTSAHAAKILRAADVKGTKASWHFQRYLRVLDMLTNPSADTFPECLARVTHVSIPDLVVVPKLVLTSVPRSWMPMTVSLDMHFDPKDTQGAMPLEAYFARAFTFQTTAAPAPGKSGGSGVLRIDRDRAYQVNRLLLAVFQRITSTLCTMHETHALAHGNLVPAHVLLVGDPDQVLASLDPKVRLLAPALDLPAPPTYTPGASDTGGYDSTLANDVLALGSLFSTVMDTFWYRRPLVSPTLPDPPEVVRRSMSEPLLDMPPAPAGMPITPSLEMHQERHATLVRQSTGSFASSSDDSGSRPGSAALARGSRADSVMDGANGPGVVSAPPTPGRREGGQGKKKKRPITIHLAPSIHPPWSPLYNEAATTVIPRPDTPEPARAQLSVAAEADEADAKELPPIPPIPEHQAMVADPIARTKTPTLVGELASNEQDRRMNEVYEGLVELVARMMDADERKRPVLREVLEYF
ncbi:hypothetical protein BCR44DRAFT_1495885 [Catenaria anguillulae PL171]|uniref:Protein kinase domain-containing protein n=1 Tax=Catenaria anguillulae PL171 TaxID=765915 RepID=A0A1Y2I2T9_9FUNG|nr:hypothetical protein BCR44DRAFT_1495885 [Catenaria anguillulae PL171]